MRFTLCFLSVISLFAGYNTDLAPTKRKTKKLTNQVRDLFSNETGGSDFFLPKTTDTYTDTDENIQTDVYLETATPTHTLINTEANIALAPEKAVSTNCTNAEACARLYPGQYLGVGDTRISANGKYKLILQDDLNFCIYQIDPHEFVWCSNTKAPRFHISAKGKLEWYQRSTCWIGTQTQDVDEVSAETEVLKDISYVKLTDTGRLAAYTDANLEIWSNLKPLVKVPPTNSPCFLYPPIVGPNPSRSSTSLFPPPPSQYGDYYKRYALTHGMPIFGTASISDDTMQLVYKQVDLMLSALQAPHRDKFTDVKMIVMSQYDKPTQLQFLTSFDPSWLQAMEKNYRGGLTNGTVVLVTEEMVCRKGVAWRVSSNPEWGKETDTIYREFDQVVHEFGHAIDFVLKLEARYTAVLNAMSYPPHPHYGPSRAWKWPVVEYWAASVQNWFNQDFSYKWQHPGGPYKSFLRTDMQSLDPDFYQFMKNVFTDMPVQLNCVTEYAKNTL